MAKVGTLARHSVEVPVGPEEAFRLFTEGVNRWWKRDSHYWNDRGRTQGLRFEPFTGGRFIEVYDAQTGEGFEIGRIQTWEPGRRLAYTWREARWGPDELTAVEVDFEPTTGGTRVTVTHRGWDQVADGQKQAAGYEEGLRDLLAWYREAAV